MLKEAINNSNNMYLITKLQKMGLSFPGAKEVLAAQIVSDQKDRATLAAIVETGNTATGASTGKRRHKPFTIVKPVETTRSKTKMSIMGNLQLTQAQVITNQIDRQFLATSVGHHTASKPVARYYLEDAWPT